MTEVNLISILIPYNLSLSNYPWTLKLLLLDSADISPYL